MAIQGKLNMVRSENKKLLLMKSSFLFIGIKGESAGELILRKGLG